MFMGNSFSVLKIGRCEKRVCTCYTHLPVGGDNKVIFLMTGFRVLSGNHDLWYIQFYLLHS